MGIYDRDYIRDPEGFDRQRRVRGPGPRTWSPVTWLIIANVAAFILNELIFNGNSIGYLSRADLFAGHIYLLITYQFVHGDAFHLFFNMMVLHGAGNMLLSMIDTRQFLIVYFGAGVLGGLVQALYNVNPIVGASAAVFGVFFAVITLQPHQVANMLLFFVIPFRARLWKIGFWAVVIEIAFFLWQDVLGKSVLGYRIANLAHLGGAFFGWLWIAYRFPSLSRRGNGRPPSPQRPWSDRAGSGHVVDAEIMDLPEPATNPSPAVPKTFISAEIDAILDKINTHGFGSLTEEEKAVLQRGSESLSRRVDRK